MKIEYNVSVKLYHGWCSGGIITHSCGFMPIALNINAAISHNT